LRSWVDAEPMPGGTVGPLNETDLGVGQYIPELDRESIHFWW
jgi:hypothetical protein